MTTLDDTLAYVLANPLESVGYSMLVDRVTEEREDARAALLHLVTAHPENDGPRLAFAEWCERNGEKKRGEFVRVQCELGAVRCTFRTGSGDHCWGEGRRIARIYACRACKQKWPLLEREKTLWNKSAKTISISGLVTTQLPKSIGLHWSLLNRSLQDTIYAYFRRGFAETIRCTAANWLAHGDAIRREHPVTRVRLTTMPSRSEMDEVCRHLAVDEQFGRWSNTQKVMLGIRWPGVTFELPPQRGIRPIGAQESLTVSIGGKAPIAEGDIVELVPTEFWIVQRYQSGTIFGVAQHGIERDGPIRVMQQGGF